VREPSSRDEGSGAEPVDPDAESGPRAHPDPSTARTSQEILEEEVGHGLAEIRRDARGLLLSGFSAGLDIGFSAFFMAVVLTLLDPTASPLTTRFLMGNMYAIGFIFVILGRSELFTEHTTLAVFPVLSGQATLSDLGRVWGLVYVSNLVGGALFALFAVVLGLRLGVVDPAAFQAISAELVDHDALTILLSAVAAGWLMGLLSWLVAAAQDTLSRVVVVWLITFGMGVVGLHHCIVGTVEVLTAVFSRTGTTMGQYGFFLFWTTIGNAVGGVALVAILKYSHAVRSVRRRPSAGNDRGAVGV
jgi:formate/nitrite transporter FocA (FNT family)